MPQYPARFSFQQGISLFLDFLSLLSSFLPGKGRNLDWGVASFASEVMHKWGVGKEANPGGVLTFSGSDTALWQGREF
jgi:ethanolamine utilization microcompartment shell protein EutS